MTTPKKMAALLATDTTTTPVEDFKPLTKTGRILSLLVAGKTLNRFEAEDHHEHCLPSTISTLQREGIVIERVNEAVPCVNGAYTCHVKRYWLGTQPENIKHARALLQKHTALVAQTI